MGKKAEVGLPSPSGSMVKNPLANAGDVGLIPGSGRFPGEVFLPGRSHEQRSLVGYSPWGCTESDTIEHACAAFSLSKMSALHFFSPIKLNG